MKMLFVTVPLILTISRMGAWADRLDPPWNAPPRGGVNFTVPGVNNVPDLHGNPTDSGLVIFFGGNQFMVLPELMAAFQKEHPEVARIFYETLPPGIIEQQLKTGSLVVGNLKITVPPDLFVAGANRIDQLDREGFFARTKPYFKNRLAIMVARGNPKQIRSLGDLARADVRVSMPNPETEGVAQKILEALRSAGGEDLVDAVMGEKQANGTTFVTRIHHRQTPMRIMAGQSDAGPVWETEILFQQKIGNSVAAVAIPEQHNRRGTAAVAILKEAPHRRAAEAFFDFVSGAAAADIYRQYGFEPLSPP